MSRLESIEPSEVYVDTDASINMETGSLIKSISPRGVSVSDITSTLNEIKSENIHLTGWQLLSITSVIFVIISISIGNYSHLDFLSKTSASTTALLQALGINKLEIAIINLVEHFLVMGCGLIVGTLVGRQISLLIVGVGFGSIGNQYERYNKFKLFTGWFGLLSYDYITCPRSRHHFGVFGVLPIPITEDLDFN